MNLTFDVKNKGIVKSTSNLLTFDVMSEVKFSADIRADLGRWMQTKRENKGISQKFVADKMGISITHLSRIENGKSGTERDTIILWAQVIGIDENEALRRYKPENDFVADESLISDLAELNNLPPQIRLLAKRQIRGIIKSYTENDDWI